MNEMTFEKSYCDEYVCCNFKLENGQRIFASNMSGRFQVSNYKDIPMPRAKKLKLIEADIEKAFHESQ